MRIVHLISSLENGGAQEVLKCVCDYSPVRLDHNVFYFKGDNFYSSSFGPLAKAIALNVSGLWSLSLALVKLYKLIKDSSIPMCVVGWSYQGNLVALTLKVFSPRTTVVFSIHNGSDSWKYTSASAFLASLLCGLLSSAAKSTIFVSQRALISHVRYRNSIIIPNPVKPLNLVSKTLATSSDLLGPCVTLASVARFDSVKNIPFLLDVVKQLRINGIQVKLLMAGGGMSVSNPLLMDMLQARGLDDQVELLGVVSDIASVYLRADYTVLTSKCESFSNVLLESIACGTPFISSYVGVAEDLLSPESIVIKGYDIADWVSKLSKVLQIRKTPMTAQSVRWHYENISTTYAPDRIARQYADCWAKAMGN